MKQTAVEWLVEQLPQRMKNYLNDSIALAKAMEKEQIIEAHFTSSGCNSFDMPTDRINSAYKAAQEYYIYTYEQI